MSRVSVRYPNQLRLDTFVARGPQGVAGATGATGPAGAAGAPGLMPVFTMQDTLSPFVGKGRFYFDAARTITQIRASVGTAPTGSPVVVNVLVNGISIGTTSIPAGSNTATTTVSKTVTATDYATVTVSSVGSTTPGSDLTVTLTIN